MCSIVMGTDILTMTKQVIDMFASNELSRMQCVFVLEAVKMSMHEEITKEMIDAYSKGHESLPGVG